MDIRRILTFALLWLPMAVVAQAPGAERHERGGRVDFGERIVSQPDSAAIIINLVNPPDSVADDGALPEPVKRYSPGNFPLPDGYQYLPMEYNVYNSPVYFSRPAGAVAMWDSGGLIGHINSSAMFGRLGMERGGLSVVQNVGRFTFTAMVEGIKLGYFNGMSNAWGVGGSVTYRAMDCLSFTAYGSYYSNPGFLQTGINSMVPVTNFGGYVNWQISEHWGVKAGAQAFRSTIGNRWEAVPTVIPYYRFSNGRELGIDVGSIVYEVIKSGIESKRGMHINPTPEIPKIGPLPVGNVLPPPK